MFNLVQHHIARFWEELRTENFEAAAGHLAPRLTVKKSGGGDLPLEGMAMQVAYLKYFLAEMRAVGLSNSQHSLVSVTATSDMEFTANTRVAASIWGSNNLFETGVQYVLTAPGGAGLGIKAVHCETTALHANDLMRPCA